MRDLYKKIFKFALYTTLSLWVVLGVTATQALAFSGYGAGTSGAPYYIGSCSQLGEMADDLSGNYKVVRNIDCAGATMAPIGDSTTPFTGVFDGGGFIISNITIHAGQDYVGLFGQANDGATIQNVTLKDADILGDQYTGSIVGDLENSTASRIRVQNAQVTGSAYTGGIIGQVGGGSLENSSSTDGTIQSTTYTGGAVGRVVGPSGVSDVYATGSVSSPNYAGGLIGIVDAGPVIVANTYASAQMYSTGVNYGGLIGLTTNTGGQEISHSFAASIMETASVESSVGGVFGTSAAPTDDIWYDDNVSDWGGCVGDGSASCTAASSESADPGYLKNSDSNGPFSNWDFSNTWVKNADDYPSLVPLSNLGSSGAPNNNDTNGDGTDDSYQSDVNSVSNDSGVWSTVSIPNSSDCSVENPQWARPATSDSYSHALSTLTGFSLYCHSAGVSVPVTIIYDKHYDTTNWVLRYYNQSTDTYQTVTGAKFGTTTVGGVTKTTVTYTVTDGGSYDSDGSANGVIVDPVVPATQPNAPNTGFGQPRQNNPIILLVVLSSILAAAGLALRQKYLHAKN